MNFSLFNSITSVVSIDSDFETVRFYAKAKGDKSYSLLSEVYKDKPFSEDFYEKLKTVSKKHSESTANFSKTALILPDNLFFSDTVKIPVIQKKAMENSLKLAIDTIFKNSRDLKYKTLLLGQNKQTATYNVLGVKKEFLLRTIHALSQGGISVTAVTFNSASAVAGAMQLSPKLKTESFLLVDVRKHLTKYALVLNGKTVGFYTLPFGYSVLRADKIFDETELFDHASAELIVLNSKERARNKQLTLEVEDSQTSSIIEDFDEEDTYQPKTSTFVITKSGKKLPKFMQREILPTEDGIYYENFRIFIKWALEILKDNEDLTAYTKPKTVYVNMPIKYEKVIGMINKEETGIEFASLPQQKDEFLKENLDLLGGMVIKKYSSHNNF